MKEALEDAEESGKKYNKGDILNYYVEILIDCQKLEEAAKLFIKEVKLPDTP